MKYRNKKTGAVINTLGEVRGEDWEPVEEKILNQDSRDEEKYDDNTDGSRNEDDVSEELDSAEEDFEEMDDKVPPATKSKTSRRGKK